MKKFFILVGTTLLIACNSGTPSNSSGRLNITGGVEQGNGMASYTNAKMGLKFNYPPSWHLSELPDLSTVTVDNSPLASAELVSSIEFSISPDFLGQSIQDTQQLKNLLDAKFPGQWKDILFSTGQSGFYSETKEIDGWNSGEYYLLDQNQNILKIYYHATVNLGAFGIIKGIVSSMTVDNTAPIIDDVRFEPAIVKAGDTATLIIKAHDEIGDFSLDMDHQLWNGAENSGGGAIWWSDGVVWRIFGGFWNNFLFLLPNLAPDRVNYFSYVGFVGMPNLGPIVFNKQFTSAGENVFTYEVKVPENAPEGKITLKQLNFLDSNTNEAKITLDESSLQYKWSFRRKETIRSKHQQNLPAPTLQVIRENQGPADTAAPIVKRIWFQRTFLGVNESQKIFFLVDDASPLKPIAFMDMNASFISNTLVRESDKIYSISFKQVKCTGGSPHIALDELYLVDEVGNIFTGNRQEGTLPDAGFICGPR